jgi:hypothetical protein
MRKSLGVLFVCLLFATGLFGQLTQLNGTVTDPAGAVVPGATILLDNVATGYHAETKSDDQGRYVFNQVTPGIYKIIAKAGGFADETIDKIELLVNQPATIPVVFQKIGSTSTTVTVEGAATQINTQDASLGNAITTQQITELPSFARNVATLLTFQPGVNLLGNVNGGKTDQGNITLDGADVNDQNKRSAMSSVLNVTLDSVQEFRTTTSNAGSDEGRSSGGQITLVTKSGTNAMHGSLYEYRRGTETAANDFFSNQADVARAPLLINIFGGTAGGAIKKNKLFYFINYEGRRDASAAIVTRTVPTASFAAGNLEYLNKSGQTITLSPSQVQTQIDTAHIGDDAAILALLKAFPAGNTASVGDGLNLTGYIFNSPEHNTQNTYIARFDWNIDDAGKHRVFFRGQLQNFDQTGTEEFPGQAPGSVTLNNSKGTSVGYTWLVRPNLIATSNWGFTRAGTETTGVLNADYIAFRGLSSPYPTTTDTARIIPVQTLNEDIAWTHGAHDIRFGAVARFISNASVSFSGSFSDGYINAPWLNGTGKDFSPSDLASSFRTPFVNAGAILMGLVTEGDGRYNYLANGSVEAQGAPVSRDFKNQEYEWYAQDTWRISRSLTFTYGIRHSLMPPVYEANGQQTTALPSLSNSWMAQRLGLANAGLPQNLVTPVEYVLAGSPQGRPLYPDHLKNFAPRIALAYSPQGTSGLSKFLFGGPGKTSIRAGWAMFYDLFGQPLAQQYASDALGFSTLIMNPANSFTTATAPRYTGFYSIPAGLLPAAPPGGFPQMAPNAFAITNSIDDQLKPPYTLNTTFSIGREFSHDLFIQGSFVQRLSRRSLVQRDVAEPTNLIDPKSGQSFYQAAQILGTLALSNNLAGVPVASVPKIPFFEDLWPGLANPAKNLTASQVAYQVYAAYAPDMTSALTQIDTPPSLGGCNPSCSIYGPYTLFNQQFSALSTFSSVGHGNYNAMQWTARKRLSKGITFDFNYTFSKSEDLASSTEGAGSYNGFIQNIWDPNQNWAVSNYDARHQINTFLIWQVPVGKGRTYLPNANRLVDGLIGGWQITPTWQWESSIPLSVGDGQNWATDWNLTTNATQIAPVLVSPTNNVMTTTANGTTQNATGGPNLFSNPAAAFAAFSFTTEGNSGSRNDIRQPGLWVINLGLSKVFYLFTYKDTPHQLQIRGEAFNVTNSVVFTTVSADLGTASTFGKFTGDTNTTGGIGPRQMQFAMRYSF